MEGDDYALLDHTEPGDVTAAVTAVDLQLGLGNTSTSGCEAGDFAGFPTGNIALLQRGTCTFQLKAENAAAAGAVGAIIFNQGNTPDRTGLFVGTLGPAYAGGIPVMSASYDTIGSPNFVRFVYDGDGSDTGVPGPAGSDAIEALFADFHDARGLAFEPEVIGALSDYTPFAAAGIPVGGVFSGSLGIKTAEQAAIYGGTAGVAYDPCYHLACDTYANVNLEVLDDNADAIAYAVLSYAMNAAP